MAPITNRFPLRMLVPANREGASTITYEEDGSFSPGGDVRADQKFQKFDWDGLSNFRRRGRCCWPLSGFVLDICFLMDF